jgi:hypothetical protein
MFQDTGGQLSISTLAFDKLDELDTFDTFEQFELDKFEQFDALPGTFIAGEKSTRSRPT